MTLAWLLYCSYLSPPWDVSSSRTTLAWLACWSSLSPPGDVSTSLMNFTWLLCCCSLSPHRDVFSSLMTSTRLVCCCSFSPQLGMFRSLDVFNDIGLAATLTSSRLVRGFKDFCSWAIVVKSKIKHKQHIVNFHIFIPMKLDVSYASQAYFFPFLGKFCINSLYSS